MSYCVNCGAETEQGQCEGCGLMPAEAERAMRRRLVNRLALFVLGALAFLVPCSYYPPLEIDGVLIFIGVLFFATIALAAWAERRTIRHQEVERLKRIFYALVPIPWLLGALLFANGALDRSPPERIDSTVVNRFSMPGPFPIRRVVVVSWREGRELERLSVSREDYDSFHRGDPVVVKIEGGLAGIPWVYGLYHR